MFDSIRKHQRLLQFLLLLLIFPAFVFFGVSGYQGFMSDDDSVATVAGAKITRGEFDQALRRQLDRMREVLGGQVDASLLDTAPARNEVLDGLIAQRVLLAHALETHVGVTDEKLRQTILSIPGLRKPDGGFDMERYKALLSAQGLNEQAFEQQLRRDLAVSALPEAAASSAVVPKAVVERLVRLQEQVREVRELLFKPADFAAQVRPTDEQLKKYYEDNAAAFETPESARIEYVVLGAESLAAQVALGADDVRTYYEQNAARYSTAEERRASHVLLRVDGAASEDARKAVRARAEDLVKQARGGADFAALAKAHSQDPGSAANGGDLGFFTRDTMVKPFADAAFALKEGEVSGVIESEFGLHVIKLTGVKPGSARPFEQVRGEIEAELRQQQAGRKFTEAADAFTNTVYEQSDSLKPAADRFGLKILSADGVTRSGAPDQPPKSPLSNPKLLAAIFSDDVVKNKRNTEAIEVGGNTLVAARIVEHRPAQRKPFESVQAQVRARVVEQLARRMAQEAGEAKLKELRGGVAAAGMSELKAVSRMAAPTIQQAAIDAVLRAPIDKLPAWVGVDLGPQGFGIYQIVRYTEPDAAAVAERLPRYQQELAQLVGQQDGADYVESLKSRSKVTRHPDRIAPKSEPR
jgi:peptidyl-prolyl cis-trans isomerase D